MISLCPETSHITAPPEGITPRDRLQVCLGKNLDTFILTNYEHWEIGGGTIARNPPSRSAKKWIQKFPESRRVAGKLTSTVVPATDVSAAILAGWPKTQATIDGDALQVLKYLAVQMGAYRFAAKH